MKIPNLMFLHRTGMDAKLMAIGTEEELQRMLTERRRARFLVSQQRERLEQIKRKASEAT